MKLFSKLNKEGNNYHSLLLCWYHNGWCSAWSYTSLST